MHPAASIIVFTTFSGMGFGLMAWLGLGFGPSGTGFGWTAAIISFGLTVVGLLASMFHLRRPERAWRALSQWRSSWLSREGVLAIATLGTFGLYVLLWLFFGGRMWWLGVAAMILSVATVIATSMIYAQIRAVPHWATWLTPASYLGFSAAGGALLLTALSAALGGEEDARLAPVALVALVIAWVLKLLWWQRATRATLVSAGASQESATGLGGVGRVRLFEAPHTGTNYLLKEMVFEVGRRRARALRRLALILGALAPLVLVALGILAGNGAMPFAFAALSFLIGLMAERWLFFAEARHAVASYYGKS
jgi:DMSO reductase anchor subunit